MAKKDRVKLLMAAVNTAAYGTDAAPTEAMRAYQLSVQPLETTRIDDPVAQPYLGAADTMMVGHHARITFSVRLTGSGAPGTVPPVGALLRMCGMSEVITAGTDVTYQPVSDAFEDGTLYYWRDGKKRALVGCRGTVSATVDEKGVPSLAFEMMGLYAAPTDTPTPAPDWSAWQQALPATKTNTPTITLLGYTPILSRCTLRLGQAVEHIMRVNDERVDITNRDAGGEIVIEEPPLAAKDYEAAAIAHTRGLLTITHGTAAGNTVQLSAPKAQIVAVSESESQGVAMQSLQMSLKPDAGNDEFTLVFK